MIFFDKTRTIGQDANGKNVVWVSVYVDTAANLPAYNAYQTDGFILCMASEGRCIDTGDLYRLDSLGTWQITQAGTGTYTKAEIDALLNAKQDVLTFDATPTQNSTNPVTSGGIWTDEQRQDALQTEDRAALVEIVDGGAKNWAKIPSQNSASSNISFVTQADGGIKVTGTANFQSSQAKIVLTNSPVDQQETVTIEGKLPDKLAISGLGASTQLSRFVVNLYNGSTWVYAFNSNDVLHDISQYTYDRYNIVLIVPNNKTYAETIYPMICTQTAWEISQTFQPYRPSWQEMYDMILALQ